jgi:hypothetical protein
MLLPGNGFHSILRTRPNKLNGGRGEKKAREDGACSPEVPPLPLALLLPGGDRSRQRSTPRRKPTPTPNPNPATQVDPRILLDYRCYVQGGLLGNKFPAGLAKCLRSIADSDVSELCQRYGFPGGLPAVVLKQRATGGPWAACLLGPPARPPACLPACADGAPGLEAGLPLTVARAVARRLPPPAPGATALQKRHILIAAPSPPCRPAEPGPGVDPAAGAAAKQREAIPRPAAALLQRQAARPRLLLHNLLGGRHERQRHLQPLQWRQALATAPLQRAQPSFGSCAGPSCHSAASSARCWWRWRLRRAERSRGGEARRRAWAQGRQLAPPPPAAPPAWWCMSVGVWGGCGVWGVGGRVHDYAP